MFIKKLTDKVGKILGRKRTRVFFDMDGTLAEYRHEATLEDMYEKDYFRSLRPNEEILKTARNMCKWPLNMYYEVFVLTACLEDSKYIVDEKHEWLDEFMPMIDAEHRLFLPCGVPKVSGIPGGIRESDLLIDDFGKNCREWHNGNVVKVSKDDIDRIYEEGRWKKVISPEDDSSLILEKIAE